MDYPITRTRGEPRFDTLGVIKLRCADSTPIDDRIFAQAQVGATAELLFARIWSFETAPIPSATLRARFSHGGHTAELSADAAGNAALLLDHAPVDGILIAYQIEGEDLQGEYWGTVFLLPMDWLSGALGFSVDEPTVLTGNLLREQPALSSAVPEGEMMRFALG